MGPLLVILCVLDFSMTFLNYMKVLIEKIYELVTDLLRRKKTQIIQRRSKLDLAPPVRRPSIDNGLPQISPRTSLDAIRMKEAPLPKNASSLTRSLNRSVSKEDAASKKHASRQNLADFERASARNESKDELTGDELEHEEADVTKLTNKPDQTAD